MNRLVTRNLEGITASTLPGPSANGRARLLFLHSMILGFRNYAAELIRCTADRDDVEAVHIKLHPPMWLRVAGKQWRALEGWDFHEFRYLKMWQRILRGWFAGPLDLSHFDLVHVITQNNALALVDAPQLVSKRFVVNIDGTAAQDVLEFGYAHPVRAATIAAEQRIFDAADCIVGRNRWCMKSLVNDYGIDESKLTHAPNAVDVQAIQPSPFMNKSHAGPVRLAFVGHAWKRKGGPDLLRVHQEFFAKTCELHVFTSHRCPRDLENVFWYGSCPREQILRDHLPDCDVYILPSHRDMQPWALIEAAAVGLPIIATNLAGMRDFLTASGGGLLVPPGNRPRLAEAISALVADPHMRREFGRRNRDYVTKHHDASRVYAALLDRLVDLAGAN